MNAMNEECDQWLKDNGYAPILTVDIKKMLLQKEERDQQLELQRKETELKQELDNSQRRRADIRKKIDEYKEEQVKMKRLNTLLQEDMMDLNNLEQQMMKTLEDEGIPQEDFVETILYGKRDQLNFEKAY